MVGAYLGLFSWLPTSLFLLISGAITIVFILFIVGIIKLILDIIPFA